MYGFALEVCFLKIYIYIYIYIYVNLQKVTSSKCVIKPSNDSTASNCGQFFMVFHKKDIIEKILYTEASYSLAVPKKC